MAFAVALGSPEKSGLKSGLKSFGLALAGRARRGFAALGDALVAAFEAGARVQEVARLRAMSDAELALHGLTRDEIVGHVFRDRFCF